MKNNTSIILDNSKDIIYSSFKLQKSGITAIGNPSFQQWLECGKFIRKAEGSIHFWIGDWLNYGEQKYGEMYSQALDETGFQYGTLANDKYVSSMIQISRRRENLNFRHHQEVASLPLEDQEKLLEKAEKEQLPSTKFRQIVREYKRTTLLNSIRPTITVDNPPNISHTSWSKWIEKQPDCDLLLTDPPYSTEIDDINKFAQEWLPTALTKVKPSGRAYICIGAYPEELLAYLNADRSNMILANILVWTYKNTIGPSSKLDYNQNWQAILYFRGKSAPPLNCPTLVEQFAVQDINAPDGRIGDRFHKWQKPDELARRLIMHSTKEKDIILDPFAGTGTFILMASRLNRIAYGCDIDKKVIEIAVKRGCKFMQN